MVEILKDSESQRKQRACFYKKRNSLDRVKTSDELFNDNKKEIIKLQMKD